MFGASAGIVVPVAHLKPASLGGVTISRASLHNTTCAAQLALRIGDRVVVERRGDVIPYVASVVPSGHAAAAATDRAAAWAPPVACPMCCAPLVHRDGAAGPLACSNAACSGRQDRLLEHFIATCMLGVGKKTLRRLVEAGLVEGPLDLYELHRHREQVRTGALRVATGP
jgi:DNA ligase (NAD+)